MSARLEAARSLAGDQLRQRLHAHVRARGFAGFSEADHPRGADGKFVHNSARRLVSRIKHQTGSLHRGAKRKGLPRALLASHLKGALRARRLGQPAPHGSEFFDKLHKLLPMGKRPYPFDAANV